MSEEDLLDLLMKSDCMKRNFLLLASFLGLLAGCAAPTASPIPTAYPPDYLPTVIALTAEVCESTRDTGGFCSHPDSSSHRYSYANIKPHSTADLYADNNSGT